MSKYVGRPALCHATFKTNQYDETALLPSSEQFQTIQNQTKLEVIPRESPVKDKNTFRNSIK